MRYKEIDINIKAIPDKEDEALLNQLMGAKGVSVSDAGEKTEHNSITSSKMQMNLKQIKRLDRTHR